MDTVFIDTSVFISENFLEGKKIREIYRLAQEGQLQIVLPIITYNELMSRIRKNTTEALQGYKGFRDKTKIIRNVPALEKRFERLDEEACIQEIQQLFDQQLKSMNTVIVEYPTINIGDIFEKYFANQFPFSTGEKKHEFPDAFAVASLEEWSKVNRRKCFVIAGDKDITQYESKYLKVVPSLSDYLDEKLRKIEVELKRQRRIEITTALYERKREDFQRQIEQWLVEQLDDERTYRKHTNYEIHEIDIKEAEVELGEFRVTSIADHEMQLNAEAYLMIEVEIEVDDFSSGWYDDDTRDWHYTETEKEVIQKEKKVSVSFKVEIPLAGDDYIDIEILDINNGQDLEI